MPRPKAEQLPQSHLLAQRVCEEISKEDPEHFEGGCGDISHLLWVFFQSQNTSCQKIAGTAKTKGVKSEKFTHVWLLLEGIPFDPMNHNGEVEIIQHQRDISKEEDIISLHTDDNLVEDWDDSYEKILLENALSKIPDSLWNHPLPRI